MSAGDGTCRIPAENEKEELDKIDAHLRKFSGGMVTAEDFVKKYIDCEWQSPAIIRTPEGWILDRTTILMFILYFQGEPSLSDKDMPRLNEPLLDKMRGRAGIEFEIWLRAQLRIGGFCGPDQPVIAHYEYDILMVSHTQKSVLLVEAKYRDVNPSSLTGANLVSQELLDDDSLLDHAKRQEQRLSFFLQNKGTFEEFLGPQRTWNTYAVRSYVVTKSPPLISRYENTTLLKASDFLISIAG